MWRRKYDDLKSKTPKKAQQLAGLHDKLKEVEKSAKEPKQAVSNGKQERTIRMLENRLDKAMIKFNEAQSIKKTYDIILKRLKEERIAYDK